MKNQKGFTIIELLSVIIVFAGLWGWVWNIMKIIPMLNDALTGMFIFRCVGVIVAPLGAILGYF